MLEREAELEALEAAIAAGSGRVLILEGAAGVGKSALLDVARDMAAERGHQVLHARGSELMRGVPFGVAVELFAEALRAATPAQRDEELFSGAGGLAASLFSPATAYRPATAMDPSLPMVHGLYWLLVNLSERAPCLMVVDDAHWADEPSLGFLVYLVERVEGLPVTVLVALRPEDAAIAGRPMDRLRASPANRILELEPLSKDGTAELIRTRYFDQADDEFCQAVFDASQGNPFIVQELARTADVDGVPPVASIGRLHAHAGPANRSCGRCGAASHGSRRTPGNWPRWWRSSAVTPISATPPPWPGSTPRRRWSPPTR